MFLWSYSASASPAQWRVGCYWAPIGSLEKVVNKIAALTDFWLRKFNRLSRWEVCILPHVLACLARLREVLVDYHPPSKTLDCRLNHLLLIVLVILHPNVVVLALLDKQAHYVLFVLDDIELGPACRKRLPSWWIVRGIGSRYGHKSVALLSAFASGVTCFRLENFLERVIYALWRQHGPGRKGSSILVRYLSIVGLGQSDSFLYFLVEVSTALNLREGR